MNPVQFLAGKGGGGGGGGGFEGERKSKSIVIILAKMIARPWTMLPKKIISIKHTLCPPCVTTQ